MLSEDRGRFEFATVSFASGEASSGRMVGVFDGANQQRFSKESESGHTRQTKEFDEWNNIHLKALILALRPLREEAFGPSPGLWHAERHPAVIDGRTCLVLTDPSADGESRKVFLDPGRDYVPLRLVREKSGRPTSQVDMQYERTAPPTWIPSSWTATIYYFGDTNSFSATRNELKEVAIGQSVPDEQFKIDYPAGTHVTVVGAQGRGEQQFVVAGDGAFVPKRQAAAMKANNGWSTSGLMLAAAGAAALAGGFLLWRRRSAAA